MVGVDGMVGEDPHGVFGVGLVRSFVVSDPVDGGEDDERMRAVEVDPEEAAGGTEAEDAAGDGDVAVVVGEDFVGDGEEVEAVVGEGLVAVFGLPQKVCGAVRYWARKGRKWGSRTRSFSRPSAGGGPYFQSHSRFSFGCFLLLA